MPKLFWVFPCFGSYEFKVGTECIEKKRVGELLINRRQDALCFKNKFNCNGYFIRLCVMYNIQAKPKGQRTINININIDGNVIYS